MEHQIPSLLTQRQYLNGFQLEVYRLVQSKMAGCGLGHVDINDTGNQGIRESMDLLCGRSTEAKVYAQTFEHEIRFNNLQEEFTFHELASKVTQHLTETGDISPYYLREEQTKQANEYLTQRIKEMQKADQT